MKAMADLFDPEPDRWGLRGDPWVWAAMRDHLGDTYLPPTVGEAEAMLYAAFNRIVGVDIFSELEQSVYRAEFAHGGLSSGHIHLQTWRVDLLPLLIDRAAAML